MPISYRYSGDVAQCLNYYGIVNMLKFQIDQIVQGLPVPIFSLRKSFAGGATVELSRFGEIYIANIFVPFGGRGIISVTVDESFIFHAEAIASSIANLVDWSIYIDVHYADGTYTYEVYYWDIYGDVLMTTEATFTSYTTYDPFVITSIMEGEVLVNSRVAPRSYMDGLVFGKYCTDDTYWFGFCWRGSTYQANVETTFTYSAQINESYTLYLVDYFGNVLEIPDCTCVYTRDYYWDALPSPPTAVDVKETSGVTIIIDDSSIQYDVELKIWEFDADYVTFYGHGDYDIALLEIVRSVHYVIDAEGVTITDLEE